MTVWSGALRLAATATPSDPEASLQAWSTCSVARPSTAAIAPGRAWPAAYISSPRRRTSAAATVAPTVPAATWALYSPRLWPAAAPIAPHPVLHHRPRRRPSAPGSRAGRCG